MCKAADTYDYPGGELELFSDAHNWKRYLTKALAPFISGRVAEIGAGIGGTTKFLSVAPHSEWLAIEPDTDLFGQLRSACEEGELSRTVTAVHGTLHSVCADERFDTILYVDVLEHIEDDRGELESAEAHLSRGGRIVALSPAYQALYSDFDASIGHWRRYTDRSLREITPKCLKQPKTFYLDSVGAIASMANRLLLKQNLPKPSQIRTWDRLMVPCSRLLDPLVRHSIGRSVVAVWEPL